MKSTGAKLEIGNSNSRISGLSKDDFKRLSFELSYQKGEPGVRRFMQKDGSVRTHYWDGFHRFLKLNGQFPSGLIPRAVRILRKWGINPQIEDLRPEVEPGAPLWAFPSNFKLRDYQTEACNKAMKRGRGVIDSPPRSGKTCMMAELLRKIARRTVITAPTKSICKQTYNKLIELLGGTDWSGISNSCADDFYLVLGGYPKTRKEQLKLNRAMVFVTTDATAAKLPAEFWKKVKCWMSDERHHQATKTHWTINELAVNAYYRFGFTGTDYRSKASEQVALEACLGRNIVRYTISEMIERGVLVPGKVEFWPIDYGGIKALSFTDAYGPGIVRSSLRNAAIRHAAIQLQEAGHKVLILVHQIEQGKSLQKLIRGSEFVKGEDGNEVNAAIDRLNNGQITCLIGSPVVGEGLDCPAADALIYAKGKQARVTHTQDVFRVLTASEGKRYGRIIDFADRHNKDLIRHSAARMRNYLDLGMEVEIKSTLPIDTDQLSLYNLET